MGHPVTLHVFFKKHCWFTHRSVLPSQHRARSLSCTSLQSRSQGVCMGRGGGILLPCACDRPNSEQGFRPKQVCAQRILATCHRMKGVEHVSVPTLYLTYIITYLPEEEAVRFAIPRLLGCCLVGQTSIPAGTPLMSSVPSGWNLPWKGKKTISSLPEFSLHIANSFGLTKTSVLLFLSFFPFFLANKWGVWGEIPRPTIYHSADKAGVRFGGQAVRKTISTDTH